ncbi:MAG: Uma2 family endonuclease [Gemmatimonadales bacterium]
MHMPDAARRYTVEEVLAFPEDGNRYELVHGELLVTPAPRARHQALLGDLYYELRAYLERVGIGRVFFSPADITWDDETLVQPDLFVVPEGQVSDDWRTYKTLLLAVEIHSPGSGRADRVVKRQLYQERRVEAYWIVDADAALVEVWHPDDERPEIVSDVLKWRVGQEAEVLEIELKRLFGALPG